MDYSDALKAIGEPKRFQILKLISETGEMNALNILEHFSITQPTLSHHMKILTEAKLVSIRTKGLWSYYSINKETLKGLLDTLSTILGNDESATEGENVWQVNDSPVLSQKRYMDESLL